MSVGMDPEGNNKALTTINYTEARIRKTGRQTGREGVSSRDKAWNKQKKIDTPFPLNNETRRI